MSGASNAAGSEIRVLLCDDYVPMRTMLRAVIGGSPGMSVVGEAGDGLEAIAEATRLQPDVVILDLAMPRKTGYQALQEIVRIAPRARIVIFSGFSVSSLGKDVLGLGAISYLQKGADPHAIIDAIEEAASAEAPVTPFGVMPTPDSPR